MAAGELLCCHAGHTCMAFDEWCMRDAIVVGYWRRSQFYRWERQVCASLVAVRKGMQAVSLFAPCRQGSPSHPLSILARVQLFYTGKRLQIHSLQHFLFDPLARFERQQGSGGKEELVQDV